jgi:AcrR family transcriptional regulator
METDRAGRRKKLEPDARVRLAILSAASKVVREEGVRALSVAEVLARTQLSTRAFYRHFDSKDQLVSAVFLEMARVEMLRLRQKMATAADPVRSVAAWIAGRLDLAFDDQIRSDLRQMSLEAQSQMFAAPELIGPAYQEMLRPLVDEIERGNDLGVFPGVDPVSGALSIHGVVWANVERQWATGRCDPRDVRKRVQRFCLRGLGVASAEIADVLDEAGADPRQSTACDAI